MRTYEFNNWELLQATAHFETDPFLTKEKLEEYLKKYPTDYPSYLHYVSILITLGQFEKAKEVLKFAKNNFDNFDMHNNNKTKVRSFKRHINYNTLRLLSYEEKYYDLYHFYLKNYKEIDFDVNRIIFFSKKMVGKIDVERRDENTSYLYRQIIEYKESEFLEHIKKHLIQYCENNKLKKSVFSDTFPITDIIAEIKKYIPSDKRLFPGFLDDMYVFRYESCGRDSNKVVDYFKVICLHNTSDIITMFPCQGCENLPYIDLNYINKELQKPKVKRLTQIEKFNQRLKMSAK